MNKQSRLAPVPASDYSPVSGAGTNPPTMKCRECDGKGEAEYMGLTDSYYRWADCHKCFGSGREAPYCTTCEGKLTVDGWCYPCDDYGVSGWALAEHSAYGMAVKP